MYPTSSTSRYEALKVSVRVAVGWVFLMLMCQGVSTFWSLSPGDQLSEAFVMFLLFLGSYVILEDIFDRLKGHFGISEKGLDNKLPAAWRAIASAVIVLLASASHSLLHKSLGELVTHHGILGTLRLFIYTYALSASCLLWVWIRGASKLPPRAARYGLLCGIALDAIPIVYWIVRDIWGNPFPLILYRPIGLELLAFVTVPSPFLGFVGGWIVDSGRFRRPTLAIAVSLAIADLVWFALLSAYLRTWIPWKVEYAFPIAVWWAALALSSETDSLLTVQKTAAPTGSSIA